MRSDRCASWLNYDKEGGSLVGNGGFVVYCITLTLNGDRGVCKS